ncbi:MAG: DUF2497 domain-containing protein [Holosporaceae bacterium]|jgi:cell pole-organizing protein PopZ|nr:DUF2497 domain-containing protein [Holosporaceae bacterium]
MEKNSEMSLDEVLSSIKKMVIDENPPVLDLTDMVTRDGSIVKIKKPGSEESDMSSFLKLAQESAEIDPERKKNEYIARGLKKGPIVSTDVSSSPFISAKTAEYENLKKPDHLEESIKKMAATMIKDWLDGHLPPLVEKKLKEALSSNDWIEEYLATLVEKKLKETLPPLCQKWEKETLPQMANQMAEKKTQDLVKKVIQVIKQELTLTN